MFRSEVPPTTSKTMQNKLLLCCRPWISWQQTASKEK